MSLLANLFPRLQFFMLFSELLNQRKAKNWNYISRSAITIFCFTPELSSTAPTKTNGGNFNVIGNFAFQSESFRPVSMKSIRNSDCLLEFARVTKPKECGY